MACAGNGATPSAAPPGAAPPAPLAPDLHRELKAKDVMIADLEAKCQLLSSKVMAMEFQHTFVEETLQKKITSLIADKDALTTAGGASWLVCHCRCH
jgi:hypothetical protein